VLNEKWALFTCFFTPLPQGAFRDEVTLKHEQKKISLALLTFHL